MVHFWVKSEFLLINALIWIENYDFCHFMLTLGFKLFVQKMFTFGNFSDCRFIKIQFLDKNQAYKTVWFLQTVKMVDGWFIQDFFKTSLRCKWGLYHFLRDSNVEFRKIENTRLSLVSSHSFFQGIWQVTNGDP